MSSSSSLSSVVCHHFSLDKIKDATNNFDKSNILGYGGEGTVYLGHIPIGGDDENISVAVKLLNPNSIEFEKEIKVVSKIQHPNLVSLLGYCNELDQKILVYEYMQNGSLSDYVKKKISICLSWRQRLNICLGAARGLQYLHTATVELPKGIIHRDMKPANILLDKNWVAKVSDFGMFKLSHSDQTNSIMITDLKGTRGYFAPECFRNYEITRKTDVYAFGVVMFEVLCRKKPWERGDDQSYYVGEDDDFGFWAMENADTEINKVISDGSLEIFADIVGRSLQTKPGMRPTMDEVVLDLERALKCQVRDEDEGIRPKALSERRASIPSSVQKLIENIKEITGNEDDEIYSMLKESSMDSIQTIRKLLFQARKGNNDATTELVESSKTTVSAVYTRMFQSSSVEIKKEFDQLSERVKSVDLHPTEPWILLGLYSGTLSIWNYQTQAIEKSFEITGLPVRSAKFIAHKQWIVAGSDDMFIRVYNYNTSEKVKEFLAHEDYIRCVAVHPTCPFVLSASDDKLVKLWDWEKDWECSQIFEGHSHYVMQVVFNPKETNIFASASLDFTIKVWNLDSPNSHLTLEGHSKGVNCVEFHSSDDKSYLISGSDDQTVKVWDYEDGAKCVQTLEGHTHNITAICVHPEIPIVITGSEDNSVRIWDATTYRLKNAWNSELGRVWAIGCIKSSSQIFIGCDNGSMSLSVEIKKEFDQLSERVKSVDLHPTEPWILLGLYSGTLCIWNYQTQAIEKSFKITESPVRSAKFIAHRQWIVAGSDDMFIRVYNYNTSEKVKEFLAHEDYIRCVAVHPTCPFVLSASDDKLVKLWDWEKDWECSQIFEGHSHYVMQVAFNPKENNTFASASLDFTIKVWNLDSPNSHLTLEGHSKGVNCVEFHSSGDKSYLISGSDDLTAKVWDYEDGAKCVQTLEGHTHNITAICVHPEIPIVITGSEDDSVRIWDATTYRLENAWNSELGRVWAIGCIKSSSQIFIGCDNGSMVGNIIYSDSLKQATIQ